MSSFPAVNRSAIAASNMAPPNHVSSFPCGLFLGVVLRVRVRNVNKIKDTVIIVSGFTRWLSWPMALILTMIDPLSRVADGLSKKRRINVREVEAVWESSQRSGSSSVSLICGCWRSQLSRVDAPIGCQGMMRGGYGRRLRCVDMKVRTPRVIWRINPGRCIRITHKRTDRCRCHW